MELANKILAATNAGYGLDLRLSLFDEIVLTVTKRKGAFYRHERNIGNVKHYARMRVNFEIVSMDGIDQSIRILENEIDKKQHEIQERK